MQYLGSRATGLETKRELQEVASNRTQQKYRELRILYRSGASLVAPDFDEAFDALFRI